MLRSSLAVCFLIGITGCGTKGEGGSAAGGTGGGGTGGGTGGSTGGQGGSAGGGTGGGTGGSGGGQTCDEGPGYPSSDAPQLVKTLTATIQKLNGDGASGVLAQACGLDICINGSTDDNGVVQTCDTSGTICTPGIAPNQEIQRPAFKYGDGLGYVKFAELLPNTTQDYVLGIRMTAELPPTSAGVPMTPGGEATSGGVTLILPAGGEVKIDKLVFDTPELEGFRAAEVPIAQAPAAVDSTLGFEMIIGTTPLDTEFCPRAKMSVPNTPAWPAGTEVEVYIHGLLVDEMWAPYAGWAKISDATVSSDGTAVVTNDGADQGVPILATFGFRMKP